ncbi:MAG: carboxypeptidase-like regulatory domain-containing protein [Bacteroidota bacterium]
MNSLIKFFVYTLSLTFLVLSCRKDVEDQMVIKEDPPAPVVNVYGNIFGLVLDSNNDPVSDAVVAYDNDVITTDDDGLFLFKNVKMNANGTYVQVEKQGYFAGSRRIYPDQNATSYMEVKLLERTIIGTVDSPNGGPLTLQSGAKIELPANGFVDADGNNYNGPVNVAMQWLDPTTADLAQIMPGNLEGIDEEGQQVLLQSYGMLAIELESSNGAPLNLGNGGTATLTFPVPAGLIGSAPATIPLWYFDETAGIWKEEGNAQLIGNEYVGEVNHFTFWNCDVPFPLVDLSGCFEGFEGTKLSNTQVEIEVISNGLRSFANTNDQGCFSGLIPLGEALNIKLIGLCGTVLFEDEIGPFDMDTDLGTISLPTFNDLELIFVTGTLVDCDGVPISDGILRISSDDGAEYFFLDDENFSVPANVCVGTNSIFLSGADPSADQTAFSDPVEFPVDNLVQAGNIEVCNDPAVLPDTYVELSFNGETFVWDLEFNSAGESSAEINSFGLEVDIKSRMIFPFDSTIIFINLRNLPTSEGQSILDIFSYNISLANFNGLFSIGEDISLKNLNNDDINVVIAELGDVGQPVTGSITTEMDALEVLELISLDTTGGVSFTSGDSMGNFPVTIEFRVIRTQ